MACAIAEGARSLQRTLARFAAGTLTQRAGPALPSYLALHHAGFSVPRVLPHERWALTPPFHPYLRYVRYEDVSQVFLRDITELRFAGGLSFCGTFRDAAAAASFPSAATASPGVTRRVALSCRSRTVSGLSSRSAILR